ncbi:MAG: hypothetical protein AB1634_19045, partial [Thermodesulfobacteriota bacterium]
ITFVVGSTVFYTSLLLGVFVVYVFDGPRATRIAISTVVGVSVMMPLIAATLHIQAGLIHSASLSHVPVPSLRINIASVIATLLDLIFLAMAWEYFGKPRLGIQLGLRAFLTLLGVMWLDVLLFTTGAFAGTPAYLSIMQGTLVSRLFVSVFALPFLYGYLVWQSRHKGVAIENRPVLAILRQVAEIELKLSLAHEEIEARKKAEAERDRVIEELRRALADVKTLQGFLPICASCKKIRDDRGFWQRLEAYIERHSGAQFSHGICPDCARKLYPELYPSEGGGRTGAGS